ncbi:MAG: hypothetical protein ACM3IH_17735, partial [Sphingobacteriales bacterium]
MALFTHRHKVALAAAVNDRIDDVGRADVVRYGPIAQVGLADIQHSRLVFILGLMMATAFSIQRVAPSLGRVYRHILCHQLAQHAVD